MAIITSKQYWAGSVAVPAGAVDYDFFSAISCEVSIQVEDRIVDLIFIYKNDLTFKFNKTSNDTITFSELGTSAKKLKLSELVSGMDIKIEKIYISNPGATPVTLNYYFAPTRQQ
jgi:hypothetical protein